MKVLEKLTLLQEALPATQPEMIPPTIPIRSNLSVMFCCWPFEPYFEMSDMLWTVIAVTEPTAERVVFMIAIETIWPGSLFNVIVPAVPELKKSQL